MATVVVQTESVDEAKQKADAYYADFLKGTLDIEAVKCHFSVLAMLTADDADRNKYTERALKLDAARQKNVQKIHEETVKQKEAEAKNQKRLQEITAIRQSTLFKALKESVVALNGQIGNTNNAFFKGQKPSWLEKINKSFHTMEQGAVHLFKSALELLINTAKALVRLPLVKSLFDAATQLFHDYIQPLPNHTKRGTVSPNR